MSRVVILTPPTDTHIKPLLPVVAELVRRGEQVTFYSIERFHLPIEAAGAHFHAYSGKNATVAMADELPDSLISLSIHLMRWTRDLLPGLLADMGQTPPDFIIYDTMSPWGWALAQILGIPAIASAALPLFNQTILMRTGKMYNLMRTMLSSMGLIQQYRQLTDEIENAYQIKFPGVLDVLNITGQLTISYTTEQFQPFAGAFGSGMRFVGPCVNVASASTVNTTPSAPHPVPTSPDENRRRTAVGDQKPLIYVDARYFSGETGALVLREVIAGLAALPVHVIVHAPNIASTVADLPANVSFYGALLETAHFELLQRASLVIASGDMSATHEAMFFDVPQLLLPDTTLQSIISAQAVEHGIAHTMEPVQRSAAAVREQVHTILSDRQIQQRAKLVGAAMRSAGGVQRAAEEILLFMRKQSSFSGK